MASTEQPSGGTGTHHPGALPGIIGPMDTSSLLWGLVLGSVGLGYLIYGRKQGAVVPLIVGLTLMIYPYFVSNTVLLVGIGLILIAIPYFIRR
jgi:hypothetical protein